MFFSQSEQILGRIHDHLAAWRASGPSAERLALMRGEFDALKTNAADAGFDDISLFSHSLETLLAQSGDVTGSDDTGLLNLLEESHDGLVADLGFVPAASREHIKSLNSLVASLLRDGPSTEPLSTFDEHLPQLRRVAEQSAKQHSKPVELTLSGGDIDADQRVLERMLAPLERMIRSSVAHGIEAAEQRAASGKHAVGRINIAVTKQGAQLLLEYSDDGCGLNAKKLAADAVTAGMTDRVEDVDEAHRLQILTRPAARTDAPETDDDRDAMCQAVRELGGLMAMKSEPEQGVHFQFRLPAILDTRRALLVTVGQYRFAIAAHTIERVMRVRVEEVVGHEQKCISIGDQQIPVVTLAAQLGEGDARAAQSVVLLVVIRLAERMAAFEVDAFHDLLDIVPKAAGAQLASIRGIAGVAVLADSSIALMLDADAFIDRSLLQRNGLTRFPLALGEPQHAQKPANKKTKRVLVLDTTPGPLAIPLALVAEIVSVAARREDEHVDKNVDKNENESENKNENKNKNEPDHNWICVNLPWRGITVPVIDSAAALGAIAQTRPWTYAVILSPMKDCQPDQFFALNSCSAPQIIEIADRPCAAPTDTSNPPQHLLGYVQLERRVGLIPDLTTLAQRIFHDR